MIWCGRRWRRLRTAFSIPWLLKPIRLISALSSGNRNRRGRGLPGCAFGVTVPISVNPNSEREQLFVHFGVLVEAGGDPDRILEPDAEHFPFQRRMSDGAESSQQHT